MMTRPINDPGGPAPPGWTYDPSGRLVPDPLYHRPIFGAPPPAVTPGAPQVGVPGPPSPPGGPAPLPGAGTIPGGAAPGTPGSYAPGSPNDPASKGNGKAANAYLLELLNNGQGGSDYGALVDRLNSQFALPSGSGLQWYPDKKVIAAAGGGYYAQTDLANPNSPWAYNVGDSQGGGRGGPGVGNGQAPTPWVWPEFHAPSFVPQTAPAAPPPFAYKDFTAPTLEEAKNQPGYRFGFEQGAGAIQTAAGAKGLLRGGGTLKALFDYGNAAAEQNYANVYRQNADTYNTNLGKEAGAYTTNWGVTKDVTDRVNNANQLNYTNAFSNAAAEFNPKFQSSQLSFADMYNRWLANLNAQLDIFKQGGV